MSNLVLRTVTIQELGQSPNIHDLLQEYVAESAIADLPTPNAKIEIYQEIESTGTLHVIAGFMEDKLIGFIVIMSPVLPHYGALISVVESFFVSKQYRNTGAGLRLLRGAEDHAKSKGSPGLLISAPSGGVLESVLAGIDYTETNRVYFKKL